MTLAELSPRRPLGYEESLPLALVFGDTLATCLDEIQSQYGCPWLHVSPVRLSDGRSMLAADLLTEVGPGGMLEGMFSHFAPARYVEVEVVQMSDVVGLIANAFPSA